jgi:hypothetical protein
VSASCPTSNSLLHPVPTAKFVAPVTSSNLIQTRFACFEETVRMSKDLIPENLLKIGSENNEIP